jgi:hypothetical protein
MGEQNRGPEIPNDRSKAAQQFDAINDFEVVDEGRVKNRSKGPRGRAGLPGADLSGSHSVVSGAAAIASGDIQVMCFEPGSLEQKERARHVEFDIVRVRGDRNDSLMIQSGSPRGLHFAEGVEADNRGQ